MRPSDVLRKEHEPIRRMLRILEVLAQRTEAGEELPVETYRALIEFVGSFAHSCHVAKKEDRLLAILQSCGVPGSGGPVGVMLSDHELTLAYVKGLEASVERYAKGDEQARTDIVRSARGFAKLTREHMDKEDNILFPLSDRVIPEEQQAELLATFERERASEAEQETRQQLEALVTRLESELGL